MRETASVILSVVTREQCRAARGLLGWTIEELSSRSSVSATAINKFEIGAHKTRAGTIKLIRIAFEEAGVEFFENGRGPGLRLVKRNHGSIEGEHSELD